MVRENVGWLSTNPGSAYDVKGTIDETRTHTSAEYLGLSEFFSRPIEIASYEWSTSILFYQNFDPWRLFLENPRVVNRITNYRLLTGTLHLNFLINGNAFYFGKLLVNYIPSDYDASDSGLIPENNVGASIRPHVYIDPTCNEGATMHLPFSHKLDAFEIPASETNGSISIRELNALRHANGSIVPLRLTILAWMEDVTLSVPTVTDAGGLVPQSTMDEYGEGPVSKPASLLAAGVSKLSDVPVIGPYARATSMAAGALSTVARLFGMSRAQTLEPVHEYVPRYAPRLAPTDQPDLSDRLTLDSKQEVTIDTRVVGLNGADEMTLATVLQRESYLDTADWLMIDATKQVLFSAAVSPVQFRMDTASTPQAFHFTSSAFGATPFSFWRGTMSYRFQVVASSLHKGRLLVQWDPDLGSVDTSMNIQYSRIIDIAEERDFTVDVGWGSDYGMLNVKSVYNKDPNHRVRSLIVSPGLRNSNGVIKVTVLNELTSPSATDTDVYLNVYVKCGDDFEVAAPNYFNFKFLSPYQNPLFSQSVLRYEPQSSMEAVNEVTKVDDGHQHMGLGSDRISRVLDVYAGEKIRSWRSLLKRYNALGFYHGVTSPTAFTNFKAVIPYVPLPPGNSTNNYWNDTYQANKNTLFTYLMKAYVGMRGGSRWKIGYVGAGIHNGILYAKNRPRPDGNFFVSEITFDPASTTIAADDNASHFDTYEGATITPVRNNPYLEVEIPFQHNNRYLPTKDNFGKINMRKFEFGYVGDARPDGFAFDMYHAIAEDFTFIWYMGPPVMYDLRDVPV